MKKLTFAEIFALALVLFALFTFRALADAVTGELWSSVYDTGDEDGVALNWVMWRGDKPAGTSVRLQLASSNASSGPWTFRGPDGTGATFYEPAGSGAQARINAAFHNNERYFRYKIHLSTDGPTATISSLVEDVLISWSP